MSGVTCGSVISDSSRSGDTKCPAAPLEFLPWHPSTLVSWLPDQSRMTCGVWRTDLRKTKCTWSVTGARQRSWEQLAMLTSSMVAQPVMTHGLVTGSAEL
jgi:hypothetical protein